METTQIDYGTATQKTNATNSKFNPKVGAIVVGATAGLLMLGGVAYAVTPNGDMLKIDENAPKGEGFEKYLEDLIAEHETASGGGGNNATQAQGTPFNIHTAPHAHNVNDNMSFDEAFASARAETGAGGVFEWRGQLYGTFLATEVDAKGNPFVDYQKVPPHAYQPPVADARLTNPDALDEDIKDEFDDLNVTDAPTETIAKAGNTELDSVERSTPNGGGGCDNVAQENYPQINDDFDDNVADMPQETIAMENNELSGFDDFA